MRAHGSWPSWVRRGNRAPAAVVVVAVVQITVGLLMVVGAGLLLFLDAGGAEAVNLATPPRTRAWGPISPLLIGAAALLVGGVLMMMVAHYLIARRRWARTLVILVAAAAAFAAVDTIQRSRSLALLPGLALPAAYLALLTRPAARSWFRR